MTKTRIVNAIYYGICLIVALYATIPPGSLQILPTGYSKYLAIVAGVAAWLKADWNLFKNPDGTPATVAYIGK